MTHPTFARRRSGSSGGRSRVATLPTVGVDRRSRRRRTPSLHAQSVAAAAHQNAMVIYGSARPPYGPVDIVVEDGLISYIGATEHARPTSARRRDRRHRQVRDAGHRQHAHALARGAPARHAAADSVRAQSLPRGRRHHRARGRRRLRQVEALAGREQRAHDHLAAHPRLPGRQQGPDRARRPRSARGSATSSSGAPTA